ncbi:attachment protein [bank vole virus 1]|uniref:Attachment protein n=1 Tax=bank vole virus 1 TaxID=2756244 RepID=A0A2H4PJ44_9MONO|nr:attachment protein [bank vole virus 1]ATW63189.1 attachment protein [bank vole virus 1]
MDQARYYTGTGRNNELASASTKIRTIPYIHNNTVNRGFNFLLDVVAVIGVVLGVISIGLSTTSIIYHTRTQNVTTKADPYIKPIYDDVKQISQYYTEYIDPRLRNILDAVTFQIPKTLASITSTLGASELQEQQEAFNALLDGITTTLRSAVNSLNQLTSIILEQFDETKLIVREINNEILNTNKSFIPIEHPFTQYPRVHTTSMSSLPPLRCTRAVPTANPKRVPIFVSNVGGMLENSCTKEPVISMANGVFASTYLYLRDSCTDYQSSIRFFEMGIVKRLSDNDPYLSVIHTWDQASPFVLQPCSLAVAYDNGYALCAESVTGVDNDLVTGNTIRLVLFTFTLFGSLERKVIYYENFKRPREFVYIIPGAGQGVIIDNVMYSIGYYVSENTPQGNLKCPTTGCPNLQYSTCDQFSRTQVSNHRHKFLTLIQVNLTQYPLPVHNLLVIPRSYYSIISHGNLYYRNSNDSVLFQLYNVGWYHKPLVGSINLTTPLSLEFLNKDYDLLSSVTNCVPGFGCPSSCEISAYGAYTPLDYNFNDAVSLIPRTSGAYPSVSYGSGNTRIDFRIILNQQLALRESSLVCYLPTIQNTGHPYCVGLMTFEVTGQTAPQLYSVGWKQTYQCSK